MTQYKSKHCLKDDRKVAIIGALVALLLLMGQISKSQAFPQTIKGTTKDTDSQKTLIGATVKIIGGDPNIGSITDAAHGIGHSTQFGILPTLMFRIYF
ncbi:MAG: hypothetical protein AAF616_13045 [Bacteroidota bacterium]